MPAYPAISMIFLPCNKADQPDCLNGIPNFRQFFSITSFQNSCVATLTVIIKFQQNSLLSYFCKMICKSSLWKADVVACVQLIVKPATWNNCFRACKLPPDGNKRFQEKEISYFSFCKTTIILFFWWAIHWFTACPANSGKTHYKSLKVLFYFIERNTSESRIFILLYLFCKPKPLFFI